MGYTKLFFQYKNFVNITKNSGDEKKNAFFYFSDAFFSSIVKKSKKETLPAPFFKKNRTKIEAKNRDFAGKTINRKIRPARALLDNRAKTCYTLLEIT